MILLTSDPVVGSTILATTLAASGILVHRGVRGRRLAASILALFAGTAITLMLAAHNIEILYRLAGGHVYTDPPLRYDFRVYSLLLMGVVLMVQGVRVLRSGVGISRGDAAARRMGVRALLIVLAMSLPIIPIHPFFGPIGSGLAVIGLLGMALAPPVPADRAVRTNAPSEPASVGV